PRKLTITSSAFILLVSCEAVSDASRACRRRSRSTYSAAAGYPARATAAGVSCRPQSRELTIAINGYSLYSQIALDDNAISCEPSC
ncbi:hypothetical protein, partial [Burkholderia multivorans]|uniref:hypothetical protein n=1 Tax=Burkholderia multivorans TaxID=87883 RepID=UPI0021C0960D